MPTALRAAAPVVSLFACACAALGDVLDHVPPIALEFDVGGCPVDIDCWTCGEVIAYEDGTFLFRGAHDVEGLSMVRWSVHFDPDPFIAATLVVTNQTERTQTYGITIALPTQVDDPTVMGAAVSGTFVDCGSDGATVLVPPGGALFTPIVDGAPVEGGMLLPDPWSSSVGPFQSGGIGPARFGAPIPSWPGGPVMSNIGVSAAFSLTALDSATIAGVFIVEPSISLEGEAQGQDAIGVREVAR